MYVLEWRPPHGGHQHASPHCLVSFVRMFRSVSAIKAFVRSRSFLREAVDEVRLSQKNETGSGGSVITSPAAIIAWDATQSPLPPALRRSRWETAGQRLMARALVETRVATELARAEQAGLLDRAQVQRMQDLLDHLLEETAGRTPPC